ncbi:MAG TPA: branched-chain amino acid ABC transporter permease [bacterium]|nr:branched-chain amino acid ABC transporter permease [bacterium]
MAIRLLLLAAVVVAPWVFSTLAQRNLLVLIAINVILVASLDLLMGSGGLLSLGQAGFMGVGAYTSALLVIHAGVPFLAALAAAAISAGGAGFLIGYPSLRLRHHYFVLVTFIFGIILTLLFTSLVALTRGPMGLPGIPFAAVGLPGVGRYTFNTFQAKVPYYYLVAAFAAGVLWLRGRLLAGRLGYALAAIREEEHLGMAVGIPTHRYKVLAFVISTAQTGLAGALYAHYTTFISPEVFTFVDSFNLFVMNMIGGAGTAAGPVIGPLLLTVVRDVLRNISPVAAEIAFGVFLIAAIALLPAGLMGALAARHRAREG